MLGQTIQTILKGATFPFVGLSAAGRDLCIGTIESSFYGGVAALEAEAFAEPRSDRVAIGATRSKHGIVRRCETSNAKNAKGGTFLIRRAVQITVGCSRGRRERWLGP